MQYMYDHLSVQAALISSFMVIVSFLVSYYYIRIHNPPRRNKSQLTSDEKEQIFTKWNPVPLHVYVTDGQLQIHRHYKPIVMNTAKEKKKFALAFLIQGKSPGLL
eukprot:934398_1